MKNKKYRSIKGQLSAKLGFSFVELIIVIAVIALVSVIGMSINNNYTEKSKNSKITSDIKTIQNSLESYKNETKTLPLPKGNQKYFDDSSNYVHYDDTTAYGVYGYITQDTIPKKYMNYTPIDPRTNQYYAYGKTLNGNQAFEIAGINKVSNRFESVVVGDYVGDNGPYNLIREYNGPDFVYDKSKNNFPYNPEERIVKAKIGSFSGEVLVNNKPINKNWIDNNELISGDEIFVGTGGQAEIFYSDGSKSYLGDEWKGSKLVLASMTYKGENNLFTKIQLALDYGSIWTKTSKLDSNSEFEIYTTDTEAAVRGTVLGMSKDNHETSLKSLTGRIEVYKISTGTTFNDIKSKLESNKNISTETFTIMGNNYNSLLINSGEQITMRALMGTVFTGTVFLPSLPPLPNEDGLENIKPKIKSIDNKEVKLEFPTSFSGTSNNKKLRINGGPLSDSLYKYDGNILTLSGAITPNNYTIKVCDSQEIKCTQEVSINKTLVYAGDPNACNPPYKVQFTGPDYTGCIDMDQSLVNSGYTLVAYAPYDGDYKLFYDTGAMFTDNDAYKVSNTSLFDTISGSNKGINLVGTDAIKYNLYSSMLSNNFAIETRVKGDALNRTAGVFALFNSNNYFIKKINTDLQLSEYVSGFNNRIKENLSLLNPGNYYSVIFKKEGSNGNLYINSYPFSYSTGILDTTKNLGNILYVGSSNGGIPSNQWNGIIDWIKIYKKP